MGLREDHHLDNEELHASQRSHNLEPLPNGSDQIDKLLSLPGGWIVNQTTIINALPGYKWSHPGLNAFFCWYYLHNPPPFNWDVVLVTAIQSLIDPAWESISPADAEQIVDLLLLFVAPNAECTHTYLVNQKGISPGEAWNEIKLLQKYGLVNNNEDTSSGIIFRITPGIDSFVRACQQKLEPTTTTRCAVNNSRCAHPV
jgi:hypothetical protein